jgi:hypothetical protein
MKRISRILPLQILGVAVALSFAARVYAEPPREELVHAYFLLKHANHNYEGHRMKAMEHVEAAGKALNLKLEGDAKGEERQWKSDQMLAEARHLLYHARGAFEAQDRDRAAAHLDKAINEIDRAIGKEPVRQRYSEPYRPDPYRR